MSNAATYAYLAGACAWWAWILYRKGIDRQSVDSALHDVGYLLLVSILWPVHLIYAAITETIEYRAQKRYEAKLMSEAPPARRQPERKENE